MMFWGWGDGMSAAGWAIAIIWAVFWIAVIIAIVLLIRYLIVRSDETRGMEDQRYSGSGHHLWHRSSALNILEERYAKGEIDRDEFLRRKADLS